MRTDRIQDSAYRKALELYSYGESNFHGTGQRAEDVVVLEPMTSRLKKRDEAWNPESAFYGNKPVGSPGTSDFSEETGSEEFYRDNEKLRAVMEEIESLGGRLRRARQMGNFQEEHRIVQMRNDLLKRQSAIIAELSVNDLAAARKEMNDGMMYGDDDFSEYVDSIRENDRRIAELEASFLSFVEKSAGGDSAADPGQSYSKEDEDEDDEEAEDDDSYDYTTCERPDGSTYGTGGKCRKGTETKGKSRETETPVKTKQQMETEKIIEGKKKTIAANEAWAKKLRAEGRIAEAKAAEEVVEFHRKQMIEAQKLLKNPPKEPKMTVDLNTPAGKWFARRQGYMV